MVLLVLGIVLWPSMLRADDPMPPFGDRWEFTATFSSAMSPFSSVEFSVKHRHGRTLIGIARHYVADIRSDGVSRILSEESASEFLAIMSDCVVPLPSDQERRSSPAVSHADSGVHTVFEVHTEQDQFEPVAARSACCSRRLRDFVAERVVLTPYAQPFWSEGEYGTLRLDADVPARVSVDGIPYDGFTPISEIRLEPGAHVAVWTDPKTGARREETVYVHAGQLTTVRVRFLSER